MILKPTLELPEQAHRLGQRYLEISGCETVFFPCTLVGLSR